MPTTFKTRDELTSWEKAYWYLRLLVNSDRYGSFHHTDPDKLNNIAECLLLGYAKLKGDKFTDDDKMKTLKYMFESLLLKGIKKDSLKYFTTFELIDELYKYFVVPQDFYVFAAVLKDILLPTNTAIKKVPDKEATYHAKLYAESLLDATKERALSNLIREWDMLTEDLSLNMERDIMVSLYNEVKRSFESAITSEELDILLTATCQEYERRVAQKRKGRAGKDLESATMFILNYFDIKCADGPEHFNAGIEVDNWVKDKHNWYIGISLKRTLRERWKQVQTTPEVLTSFKIKNIIHLLNNDRDLSDAKIGEMGSSRHLFFVADNSKVLEEWGDHPALGQYLFPMSSLIDELKKLMD